ncbi:MAG: hypothetical protein GX306_00390 [Clostridiales bacterium]|jgi:hypothetical protein|nr:hypothetical protein [Clostridiales bacterium]
MKLKYYLRGLGIGIILTTLIFILSGYQKKPTDEEIIELAKGLGMTMVNEGQENLEDPLGKVLEEIIQTPAPTQEPSEISPTPSQNADETEDSTVTPSPDPTQTPTPSLIPEATEDSMQEEALSDPNQVPSAQEPTQEPDDFTDDTEDMEDVEADEVTFTIEKGMTSTSVSQLLYELGLVENATDFDQLIIREGKSRVIDIGTYTIRKGTSYEDIINIITK